MSGPDSRASSRARSATPARAGMEYSQYQHNQDFYRGKVGRANIFLPSCG